MTTLKSFHDRLSKIGVEVTFTGNYPWIYLDTVNGVKVKGTFMANHGFTAFFSGTKPGQKERITDITEVFKIIRKTLI